jgi:hypothetical protein
VSDKLGSRAPSARRRAQNRRERLDAGRERIRAEVRRELLAVARGLNRMRANLPLAATLLVALPLACTRPPRAGPAREEKVVARVAPAPPLPASPPAPGEIGTASQTTFVSAAVDGRWVVICQARSDTNHDGEIRVDVGYHGDVYGDDMEPYLVMGSGEGVPIDDYVASSRDGHYLAVMKDKRLVLIDTVKNDEIDLSSRGADARDDPSPFGRPRAASFDDASRHLLYLADEPNAMVVVRELASGSETRVSGGAGALWRAWLDGPWTMFRVIANDTNHDGKLGWPRPRTSLGGRRCRGPISSYSVFGGTGDEPTLRAAGPGKLRDAPDLVRALGSYLLLRRDDGALQLESADGKEEELAPASCGARLLEAVPERQRVVVACLKGGSPASVHVFGRGTHSELDVKVEPPEDDHWSVTPERFVRLGYSDVVVDLERSRAERFAGVIAVRGEHVLMRRERKLFVARFGKKGERELAGQVEDYPAVYRNGPWVFVEPVLIDIEREKVIGKIETAPFALSSSGWVLSSKEPKRRFAGIPFGPLVWARP